MPPRLCLIIMFCVAAICLLDSRNADAFGIESNSGLRFAERINPAQIRLVTGPGLNPVEAEKRIQVFQVYSATDPDFKLGVSAQSVRITKTEKDIDNEFWKGPNLQRFTLNVTLPENRPMKAEHRYWIHINSSWVIAKNRQAMWIVEPGSGAASDLDPRYGIRESYILTPSVLHIVTGPGLDCTRLYDTKNIAVTSLDDADFREPVHPVKIGRRSNLDAYLPIAWPWKFLQRHELFLVLDKAMKNGKSYSVDFNANKSSPLLCGTSKVSLTLDDNISINPAIKVNQCGYLPDADAKFAYLGMWMGDLNACDFSSCAMSFEVREALKHSVVLTGKPALRRKATYKLEQGKLSPDPKQVPGPETVYKQDLSYEDVYELDLTALKKEGEYYIVIPGMGRSLGFHIANDVYTGPFKTVMNGLFHQRSGIELKEPWTTHYSPAGHRNKTEYSTFRVGIEQDPFKNLPKLATDGIKHDLWGGHHDAGDWNPRSHLEVAEVLFLLYEMNQAAFSDGMLNIPENTNGIPDILDEAEWALGLWTRLQDDDGGVHNGIESNGDPDDGVIAATDRLREFAFAKDAAGSYWFAAVAAQASTIWKGLGRDKEAAAYLEKAVRAWNWAEKNGGESEHDRHVFASAMLLRATHEKAYGDAFQTHSVYARNPASAPDVYSKYNQIFGSYYYAMCADADPKLKTAIAASFENDFNGWAAAAETTTYRVMHNPYSPNTWGTGGLPIGLIKPAMTMSLTKNSEVRRRCRHWITLTNDFSLGCDPMNLVFTVGLGQRYVTSAWHFYMLGTPEGIIPGLQSEGPGGAFIAGEMPKNGGMDGWPGMSLYPPGPWPDLYKYSEDASPGMNEGVTVNMVNTAFAYGLLMPALK